MGVNFCPCPTAGEGLAKGLSRVRAAELDTPRGGLQAGGAPRTSHIRESCFLNGCPVLLGEPFARTCPTTGRQERHTWLAPCQGGFCP